MMEIPEEKKEKEIMLYVSTLTDEAITDILKNMLDSALRKEQNLIFVIPGDPSIKLNPEQFKDYLEKGIRKRLLNTNGSESYDALILKNHLSELSTLSFLMLRMAEGDLDSIRMLLGIAGSKGFFQVVRNFFGKNVSMHYKTQHLNLNYTPPFSAILQSNQGALSLQITQRYFALPYKDRFLYKVQSLPTLQYVAKKINPGFFQQIQEAQKLFEKTASSVNKNIKNKPINLTIQTPKGPLVIEPVIQIRCTLKPGLTPQVTIRAIANPLIKDQNLLMSDSMATPVKVFAPEMIPERSAFQPGIGVGRADPQRIPEVFETVLKSRQKPPQNGLQPPTVKEITHQAADPALHEVSPELASPEPASPELVFLFKGRSAEPEKTVELEAQRNKASGPAITPLLDAEMLNLQPPKYVSPKIWELQQKIINKLNSDAGASQPESGKKPLPAAFRIPIPKSKPPGAD